MRIHDILKVLVCPACKGQLKADDSVKHLTCEPCALVFPVRDDIPVMLVDEAETLRIQVAEGKST